MKCQKCGAENPQDAAICESCKANLPIFGPKADLALRAMGRFAIILVPFTIAVLGVLLISTSQHGNEVWNTYYWDEGQLAWGILMALMGSVLLGVALVSEVVSEKLKKAT